MAHFLRNNFRVGGGKTIRGAKMRIYLVIVDETDEARTALRFASRRAAKTGGSVHILSLLPKPDFVAWGGVQATMEQEARARAEALVQGAAGSLFEESGQRPTISILSGDPAPTVRGFLAEHPEVAALVLGAAPSGPPGPLVAHFSGHDAGNLPCPLMIIPGGLDAESIDRLS